MKEVLRNFQKTEGYKFTWETCCTECGEEFECQEFIPTPVIKKMISDRNDDCIAEHIGNSSNEKLSICPRCRKEMGMD